jgi:hypothetical protein
MFYSITDAVSFSFPFPPSEFHTVVPLLMFYIWVCIWLCLFLCVCLSFVSVFHVSEKTCSLSSGAGSLHFMLCPPVASIYLQTTCHYSLWLNKTLLCMYTICLIDSSVVGYLGCFQSLAIVNNAAMNISEQVSIVSWLMFFWIDAQEWYHWIIWQFYL